MEKPRGWNPRGFFPETLMKLEQLSGATVLRRNIKVKKKKTASRAVIVPPGDPLAKNGETSALTDCPVNNSKTIVVPVELSLAAHSLLQAFATNDGCDSAGAYIVQTLKLELRAMAVVLRDEGNPFLDDLFRIDGKEVGK